MVQNFNFDKTLNKKMVDILKIRAQTIQTAREWFKTNSYIEVQGPIIIPANNKWPNYLETKIFNKKAHLSQGLQPYDQALVEKLEKIYSFQPTFRTESIPSKNHLVEYWRIEVSEQTSLEGIMKVQENLIEHICQNISKTKNPQTTIKKNLKRLEKIKAPFQKITYDKAIQILQKQGSEIVWGQEIDKNSEKKISFIFDQPFFITELPLNSQTYFYETLEEKSQQTKSADLIAPQGFVELSSCAQRIIDKKELKKKMIEIQLSSEDQQWYLNQLINSKTPQSGFALGFERLIQWMCNLRNIKQTTPYPRTKKNIYP